MPISLAGFTKSNSMKEMDMIGTLVRLADLGVTGIKVTYEGSGDSGAIENVVYTAEKLRKNEEDAFEDIINYQLEPEIYSFNILNAFVKKIDNLGIADSYPVHLKIDTGMHRLGFEESDLEKLAVELKKIPQFEPILTIRGPVPVEYSL